MKQVLAPLFQDGIRIVDYFFDPDTEIIYFLKSIENKKIKFSTRVKKSEPNAIGKAKRFANSELRERLNRRKGVIRTIIRDELPLWHKVKETEGISSATLIKVASARDQIAEFWGDKFPSEITRDNLTAWYSWWAENHADIQMENACKYMRNFAKYLAEKIENGRPLLASVPPIRDPQAKEIKAQRKKKKENIISNADLKAILAAAESPDDELLALFMYTMATRIDETLKLRFGHEILMDGGHPIYRWTLGQNKADLWGEHDLHPVLIPRLKELKARRDIEGTDLLFHQSRDVKKALKPQQVDWEEWRIRSKVSFHWSAHTFRHTCLTNLFNDEKNPQALICKLYRTSLAVAIETYVKVTTSGKAKMREAIKVDL